MSLDDHWLFRTQSALVGQYEVGKEAVSNNLSTLTGLARPNELHARA
jgi:hypothetical protein